MANSHSECGKQRWQLSPGALDLSDLPVDCLANVIYRTSPKDACQLSLVASWLRSVADSDQVWEKFPPADYREILDRSTEGTELLKLLSSMSGKQLYRHLCAHDPLLIDGETKSFWIDKSTGKKCFLLGARALSLSFIKAPKRHRHAFINRNRSRFGSVLQLFGADYWIKLSGAINPRMLSPGSTYGAYLIFDNVAGEEVLSKEVKALLGKRGEVQWWWNSSITRKCQRRDDGWLEVELVEVLITGEEDADLTITLEEKKYCYSEESDLIFEGIEIRVKH